MWEDNGTIRSDWNFDTVKSNAAMGTFRSMARDLVQPSMDEDEYLDEDESGLEDEDHGSVDTGAATKGSDPFADIGQNARASHSTMIIKPASGEQEEPDAQSLLDSGESGSGRRETNPSLCAPPAYTGSVRASRRSSYKARNDVHGAGSLLREADLGTGVDTIRPHKKVDTVGSLRLSAEFVGSLRKEGAGSTPSSPSKGRKRGGTELVRAGESIIDEVVLPILQNVGLCLHCRSRMLTVRSNVVQAIGDDMDAREIESLSMLQRGFADLKDTNPELAYNVILDILSGINE